MFGGVGCMDGMMVIVLHWWFVWRDFRMSLKTKSFPNNAFVRYHCNVQLDSRGLFVSRVW